MRLMIWESRIVLFGKPDTTCFCIGDSTTGSGFPLIRNALLDEWNRGYVKTARAKGLSTSTIILKHMLKTHSIQLSLPFRVGLQVCWQGQCL